MRAQPRGRQRRGRKRGEVRALSYVFTHAAESGRDASPLRVLTPGECISGGEEEEEEEEEAREHLARLVAHTGALKERRQRGHHV